MKFTTLLVIALLGVLAWFFMQRPEVLAPTATQDPVAAMRRVTAEFPDGQRFYDVSYDVQKTDSMVNPVIGYLNFSGIVNYQYVFHWLGDRWVFSRMICRDNGKDFTDLPGGLEIMDRPEMSAFLARYGRAPSSTAIPPPTAVTPATLNRNITSGPPVAPSPRQLPRDVMLTTQIQIPILVDGKPSGSATLPRGTRLPLVSVSGDSVTVRHVNSTANIPISFTDLRPAP